MILSQALDETFNIAESKCANLCSWSERANEAECPLVAVHRCH